MPTRPHALPKSLHTVTVLVNVARALREQEPIALDGALADAVAILGYSKARDAYALIERARAILATDD